MNTNKGSVVKQSGNDVGGYRPQKVLFQPNVRNSAIQCKYFYNGCEQLLDLSSGKKGNTEKTVAWRMETRHIA